MSDGGIPESLSKNWLPLTVGAGGAALLGAGRAGSPASQLGMGLVGPILGYYVNQAATADERMRRQKIEDEILQQKRDEIARAEQYRLGDIASRLGYVPGEAGAPGGVPFNVGGQAFNMVPSPKPSVEPFAGMAEQAWGPEAAARLRAGLATVDPRQIPTYIQPYFSAFQAGEERRQRQGLSGMIEQLGRGTGEEFPGGAHTMQPPAFTPQETAFYRTAIQTPQGQQKLFDTIAERLAMQDPRFGAAFPTPQAGPGEQMTRTITQVPGKRPQTTTQISPVPYGQTEQAAVTKARQDQATRMSVSPQFAAIKSSLPPEAQFVLQATLNDAIATGSADSLSSVQNLLLSATQPEKIGLQQLEAAYFQKNPKAFADYMRTRTEGKDKETFYLKQIANVGQRKQYLQHTYDSQGKVTLNPALATMEQEESTYWRRLAESDPQHYAQEAFTHLPRLLRWDRATFDKELKDFATRYNIPLGPAGAR